MPFRYPDDLKARTCICVTMIALLSMTSSGQEQPTHWNRFRGPNGQGIADTARIPVDFSRESIVLWKTAIPLGHSSPAIEGNRIFFTATESANKDQLITLCVDRESGSITWRQIVQAHTKARLHRMNHSASSSPAVDEKHVYAYFGTFGLICYDHNGNKVWDHKLKTPESNYGAATSPIVYKDKVILVLDDNNKDTSRLLAVNRDTGETVWEQPRSLFTASWSTPMIWSHGDTEELIVLGCPRLTSYNPAAGEEVWWAGGFPFQTVGTPVTGDGLLFACATSAFGRADEKMDIAQMWKRTLEDFDKNKDGKIQRDEITEGFGIPMRVELPKDSPDYGIVVKKDRDRDGALGLFDKDKDGVISEADWNEALSGIAHATQPTLLAVRPGATKDARPSHVAWEIRRGIPEVPSLLYCRGRLYLLRDGGILTCLEASSGKELFRERVGAAGQYIASPIAAGDKVLVASVAGIVTVIQADDKLKILTRRDFGERIFATPAITENRIYLRTTNHLYALGERDARDRP